jgi:hypothetical protein
LKASGGSTPKTAKKSGSWLLIATVTVVALLGGLVYTWVYIQANPASIEGSNPCVIAGQPAGMYLRIVYDSNGSLVSGAQVTAVHKEANDYCNGVLYAGSTTTTSFVTGGTTAWYSLDSTNAGTYSFTIEVAGHLYSLSASLAPVSVTCSTLYVPLGRTNTTISELKSACS